MPPDYLQTLRRVILEQALPVDKFGHQPRLSALTFAIGADLDYDRDIVEAAAWLHDLGVFVGNRPEELNALVAWDHVAFACSEAPAILRQAGFPEEKIPAVLDAIRQHQPKDDPATLEAVILRDADILEQLGAVTILRTVSKIGRDTRFKTFPDALHALQNNAETLPAQLKLPRARKMAETRLHILRAFLAEAIREGCALES